MILSLRCLRGGHLSGIMTLTRIDSLGNYDTSHHYHSIGLRLARRVS